MPAWREHQQRIRNAIEWDREKLARFKLAYAEHQAEPGAVFLFEGHAFVVGYAKYLIEHLEEALPRGD